MIFWILIGLVIVVVVIAFFTDAKPIRKGGLWYWQDGFASAGWAALASSVVAFFLFAVAVLITFAASPHYLDTWSASKDTHSLTALKTDSSIEGRGYFLGGGYVDGKRVLNYIQTDGDAYYVKSSDADDSVIHESDGKPKVIHEHVVGGFWWLAPFPLGKGDSYDFYVPKGSVLSDYTVNNN